MFQNYSAANMQTTNDLAVRYNVTPVDVDGVKRYDVMRVATKNYSFVGMTHAAANACARAKVAQYTRNFYTGDVMVTRCMADIAVRHTGGNMWSCEISVNESETRRVASRPTDPESLFPTREYDGGGGSSVLSLDSAVRVGSSVSMTYTANIPGLVPGGIISEGKDSSTSLEWVVIGGANSATIPVNWEAPIYIRLRYGMIESNALEV